MQIVKVKFNPEDKREYSYYSEDTLQIGDRVNVPTKTGEKVVTVSTINIPESDIELFKAVVRTIPANSVIKELEPGLEPDESWKDIKPLGPITDSRTDAEKKVDGDFIPPSPHLGQPDSDIQLSNQPTAIIVIKPEVDLAVQSLEWEITKLRTFAKGRVITTDADLTPVTDDLTVIAKIKKALTEKLDSYVKPIKGHLADIQAVFNPLFEILKEADKINREKMTVYIAEQQRKAAEIAEVNRQAEELARKQAALNQGVFTVDTTPIPSIAPVKHIYTGSGTASMVDKPNDWEIENEALIPREYLKLDEVKIGRVIRAGGTIPGIKVIPRTGVRVTTR
jgi:hypothetical protein